MAGLCGDKPGQEQDISLGVCGELGALLTKQDPKPGWHPAGLCAGR